MQVGSLDGIPPIQNIGSQFLRGKWWWRRGWNGLPGTIFSDKPTLQLGKAGDYKWWDGGINGVEWWIFWINGFFWRLLWWIIPKCLYFRLLNELITTGMISAKNKAWWKPAKGGFKTYQDVFLHRSRWDDCPARISQIAGRLRTETAVPGLVICYSLLLKIAIS